MNKKQLDSIEKKARRVAEKSFSICDFEDKDHRRIGYGVDIDGHIYGTLESFYEAYPECKPRKQERVYGPYRVKEIGVEVYEVVEMVNNHSNTWEELRPRKTYASSDNARQIAYAHCLRLNKRWQEQLNPDEWEMLEYWKSATN